MYSIHKTALFVLLSFILGCPAALRAQERFTGYWEPKVSIGYGVAGTYSHNFSLTNRSFLIDGGEGQLRVRQFELGHFSNLALGDNQSLALGVQYRFRNSFDGGADQLRITEQYSVSHRQLSVRYGQRIRAEQQFHKGFTVHRFRYRFAVDFPLKGQKVDPGEPYLVGSLEQLLSLEKGMSPQYDARLVGQIGWEVDPGIKLQMGLEYRMEEYTSGLPQSILMLLTAAKFSL